jgi:hypothetical protein
MAILFDALRWDLVADGVQILMCGVILACLVHVKLKHKRLSAAFSHGRTSSVFSQEVFIQALRQQAEQALAAIRAAIENEQAKLEQFMEAVETPWRAAAADETARGADHGPLAVNDSRPIRLAGVGSRYDGIRDLAETGLSVRQIATQTRLPAGEIELALRLQRQDLVVGRQE